MLDQNASRRWVETPCVILSSDLEKHRSRRHATSYRVDIRYAYWREGQRHEGNRYDFTTGSTNLGVDRIRAAVAANPAGRKATCLANPSSPSESVFTRELPLTIWFGAIFLVGPVLGGAAIWHGWRGTARPALRSRTLVRPA